MTKSFVNLHIGRKQNFMLLGACALLLFLFYCIFSLATADNVYELDSLLRSNYLYSAVAPIETGQDGYYQFDAGIGFSLSEKSDEAINAEVVMQPDKEIYTRSVYWNAKILGDRDIAISKNLAKRNSLNVGDKLYSKHVVNGEICKYTIEQIIPAVEEVRISNKQHYTDGLIIMGYDARYAENISHSAIFFTNMPIDNVSASIGYVSENIVYRSDEIWSIMKSILPFLIVILILTVLSTVYEVIRLTGNVAVDFKRMVSMGYEKRELDRSLNHYLYGSVILVIAFSSFASLLLSLVLKYSPISGCILIIMIIAELVAALIVSSIQKKHLWRT